VTTSEGEECRACALEWEHCHGTLVEQPDGDLVCSDDPSCRLSTAAHEHSEAVDECRRTTTGQAPDVVTGQDRFRDRREAGRALAERVRSLGLADPVVLALPRGGVPVAAEVAAALDAPLDVLVARKLGLPGQPEFGVGAIAEGGEPLLDEHVLSRLGLSTHDMADTVAREREELARRVAHYRGERALPDLTGRQVVLVDDGLATGVTARAALRSVRSARPDQLVLAVPVCAPDSARALAAEADHVVCVLQPVGFGAVGAWYERFDQTSDAEVLDLLAAGRR
jgi:putative phosphoribosyl transferase